MGDTFTPSPGTGYWNLSGPNVGLTGLGTGPQGPSKPGYVQGTADTVPVPSSLKGVLGSNVSLGSSTGGNTPGGGIAPGGSYSAGYNVPSTPSADPYSA